MKTLSLFVSACCIVGCTDDELGPKAFSEPAQEQVAADPRDSTEALVCDGIDDAVLIDVGDAFQGLETMTLEFWFRPDRVLEAGNSEAAVSILHAAGDNENTSDFGAMIDDGYAGAFRSIQFGVATTEDGVRDGARGTGWLEPLEAGRWYHVAATIDSASKTSTRLFLDGVPKPNQVWPDNEAPHIAPHTIMLCQAARPEVEGLLWHRFAGAIDELHITSSVLYDAEFTPSRTIDVTSDSLLAVSFDDSLVVDAAPLGHAITVEGNPAFERR